MQGEIEEAPDEEHPQHLLALVNQRLKYFKELIHGTRECFQELFCSTQNVENAIVKISILVEKLSEEEKEPLEHLKDCLIKIIRAFAKSDDLVNDVKWQAERLLGNLNKLEVGDSREDKERKCERAMEDFEKNVKSQLDVLKSTCQEFQEIIEMNLQIKISIGKLNNFIECQKIKLKSLIGLETNKTRMYYIASGGGKFRPRNSSVPF